MRQRDGGNERGFWTCHATFEAVGSTGLAALLRHINYLSHQSDTQHDNGLSAETKSEDLARALCCSTKTIQRLVKLGRDLEVLTTRQLQHSQVFTVEYDHLAQLIGRCGLEIPKWMLTPGARRSRAGTQLQLEVEGEFVAATQQAEEPQGAAPQGAAPQGATQDTGLPSERPPASPALPPGAEQPRPPPADEEDGVEPLTIETIQAEIKRESGLDLQWEWAMAVEGELIQRLQSPDPQRRPQFQRRYAASMVKRWIGEGKNLSERPQSHDLPPALRRDGPGNRTVGAAAEAKGVPVEKYLASTRRGGRY